MLIYVSSLLPLSPSSQRDEQSSYFSHLFITWVDVSLIIPSHPFVLPIREKPWSWMKKWCQQRSVMTHMHKQVTANLWQSAVWRLLTTMECRQRPVKMDAVLYYLLHFLKKMASFINLVSQRILTLGRESADILKRPGPEVPMAVAATAPPYSHCIILKVVWLYSVNGYNLWPEESLTSVCHR